MPSSQRIVRPLLAVTGALTLCIAFGVLVVNAQSGRILPGTVVAGVDLGGQDVAGARRLLTPALERESGRPLAVSAPGERVLLRPREAGLVLDVPSTADAAFARGRSPTASAVVARLTAPLRTVTVAPRGSVDEVALQRWIADTADRLERAPHVGGLRIATDPFEVTTDGPVGGVRIDRRASADRLRAALLDPEVTRIELVVTTPPPPSTYRDIERLADLVLRALDGPLVLHHEERRLIIEPDVLAGLLTVGSTVSDGRERPVLLVPVDRVDASLGVVGRTAFDRAPRDARFITQRPPPSELRELSSVEFRPVLTDVPIVLGVTRVEFDPRLTAAQITELVSTGRRIAAADVIELDPGLSTASALAGRPTHLIGTFTTVHAADTARTINIRLLADLLDDRMIAPDEAFSVNAVSGPRRCEDGFVPAGTIVRGELVDTCGGGVSQFGTTILNAAFFAGVPLEQWRPHSFFISRYPAGREATLNYPELDVRFRNDTDGWIVLRTDHTPDSITVSLYGVPMWSSVRADHGEPRAPRPFTEVVRDVTDLRPGALRVVQSGGDGFTLTVSRTRTPPDDAAEGSVERWTTVYLPQQRIIEVGALPATTPPPPGD